ncbi:MAG: molybdenum cofactor guanylyltransferase [Deltaproteobacteria bacterium]|nr:molybdenum cofactor guanylyltransferase [Deltaproteobacteria bacterium]
MTGIILSGGKNLRMGGKNKAFVSVDGAFIIDRVVNLFQDVFDEIIVSTNTPLDYIDYDVHIVTDIVKNKAAIGGIYTGLLYASSDHCFVAACDMPFLDRRFIEHMIARIGTYDIVVPESSSGLQPLHAIYSKKCLPYMKKLIDGDRLKIRPLFKHFKTLTIPSEVIKTFDPDERMFLNINSPEDLDKVRMERSF